MYVCMYVCMYDYVCLLIVISAQVINNIAPKPSRDHAKIL